MELAFLIAFIVSNLAWLIFNDREAVRHADERRDLLNRKAEPSMVIPPKEVVRTRLKIAESKNVESDPDDMTENERREFAAVGQINPELYRPENNS